MSGERFTGQCPRCVLELGLSPTLGHEPVHETIGPYRVVEVLGEGGMGIVYLADQAEPIKRRVAVKLIRHGLATDRVLARFEAERQALAMMNHPNVARVYDAGETTDGRPYFAMEYIDGLPITEYCDRSRSSTDERLRLLTQVCRGVHHAHQKGIIHRDLKPANVLVETQGETAVPRIIDFGISKALEAHETARSAFTRHGHFVGTPEYMSPEQARVGDADIDTRTDVYSLGVLMYELLVGALPLDCGAPRRMAFDEICRAVREEVPSRPSARIATLDTSSQLAERRRTDVTTLRNRLRGDLDWITMKALEKERDRRYGSAEDLALDLERHLNDEPVTVGPPSRGYLLRKFVRRHRVAVAAATVALTGVLAGSVAATYGLLRARAAEKIAVRDAETAEQAVRFLEQLFQGSDPIRSRGAEMTAREMLDVGAERIDDLEDRPRVQARLLFSIGKVYLGLGRYAEAGELLERSLRMRVDLLGEDHPDTLETQNLVGSMLFSRGRYGEAERMQREGLERAVPALGRNHEITQRLRNDLGLAVWRQARFDEAEEIFDTLLADRLRLYGEEHPHTLSALNNLANVYMMQGRYDLTADTLEQALEGSRKARGDDHPATLDSLHNYGMALARAGKWDEAEPVFREVIALRRRVLGDDHPRTLGSMFQLANLQAAIGDLESSLTIQREVLEKRRQALGERHMDTLWSLSTLALTLQRMGRLDEAEPISRRTLELRREILGDTHPDTLLSMAELGRMYVRMERIDAAESLMRERLSLSVETFGETNFDALDAKEELAQLLLRQDRAAQAVALLEPGLETIRTLADENPILAGSYLGVYGRSLVAERRFEEAIPLLQEARAVLGQLDSPTEHNHLRRVLEALIEAQSAVGAKPTTAIRRFRE